MKHKSKISDLRYGLDEIARPARAQLTQRISPSDVTRSKVVDCLLAQLA